MADYYVYILTNKPRGTLYVGITNNLVRRIYEHREGAVPGFTKNIKHWPRVWKLDLVNSSNPQWRDLYKDITR